MYKFKFCFFFNIVSSALIISCSPLNISSENLLFAEKKEKEKDIGTNFSDFETILQKVGCRDFQTAVWNYIYRIVSIEKGKTPPYQTVKEKINLKIQTLMKNHHAKEQDINNFATRFVEIYALITEFMEESKEEATETLVKFEYGAVTQNHSDFINKLTQTFAKLDKNSQALNQNCQEETETHASQPNPSSNSDASSNSGSKWDIRWFYAMKKNVHPLIYGARKVMATAYQSCSALDLPLMSTSQHTKGIKVVSKHPSGYGWRRTITNLHAVNSSHYYLKHSSVPQNKQCLNINSFPLIYDYGGKPSTSLSAINLFRNSGSGSKYLGVDCSGFVSSAMASAGLRLKPDVFIRPIHVKGINSWMFKNAHKNKLFCLVQQDISHQNPLQEGDIIASNSHVFIVEFTGHDPFNLNNVKSSSKCHSRKIKLNDLNFTVIQSSAHNNGVGINRMHIRNAANGLHTITKGLKKSASRACYKMFGQETHTNINEISILRHASDEPACRDREIYLNNQECLQTCEPTYLNI